MSGGAGADTISGGDHNDDLFAAENGQNDHGIDIDTIIGGLGDDFIAAGYGDNVNGGANGNDGDALWISFRGATSGVTANFGLATQVIGGGTITGIENVRWVEGSNYGDHINLISDSATGYLDAYSQVRGWAGNDTLIAGHYTGEMTGDDGDDVLDGRASVYLVALAAD